MELFGHLFNPSVNSHLSEEGDVFPCRDTGATISQAGEEPILHSIHEMICLAESILDIDPSLSEQEILRRVAKDIVLSLQGEYATIWIYDTERKETAVIASYPVLLEDQEIASLGQEVSLEVINTGRNLLIPNLSRENKFGHADQV